MIDFLCNSLHFMVGISSLCSEKEPTEVQERSHMPQNPHPGLQLIHLLPTHAFSAQPFPRGPLQAGLAGSTCFIPVQDSEWEQNGWQNRPRGPGVLNATCKLTGLGRFQPEGPSQASLLL